MKDVIQSRQRGSRTQPATFTSADNVWEKQVLFSDGILIRQSGIPAAHAKGVPNDATKHLVWKRKKGMHAISLFKNDGDGETWVVHVANGGRDYVSDTFTDVSAAKKHITELRETGEI